MAHWRGAGWAAGMNIRQNLLISASKPRCLLCAAMCRLIMKRICSWQVKRQHTDCHVECVKKLSARLHSLCRHTRKQTASSAWSTQIARLAGGHGLCKAWGWGESITPSNHQVLLALPCSISAGSEQLLVTCAACSVS
jgi:hypothetical protein